MRKEDEILTVLSVVLSEVRELKSEAREFKAETNAKFDALTTHVKAIQHHQNEDYALLKNIDEKVTTLAEISEVHEQKFQKLRTL